MQFVIVMVLCVGVFLLAAFAAWPMPPQDKKDSLGEGGNRIIARIVLYMILVFGALKVLWPELLQFGDG